MGKVTDGMAAHQRKSHFQDSVEYYPYRLNISRSGFDIGLTIGTAPTFNVVKEEIVGV